jgi:hypothetical protein
MKARANVIMEYPSKELIHGVSLMHQFVFRDDSPPGFANNLRQKLGWIANLRDGVAKSMDFGF